MTIKKRIVVGRPETTDFYKDDEIARRRDEVIRQMANTPPRHVIRPQTKKKTGAGLAAPKSSRAKKAT